MKIQKKTAMLLSFALGTLLLAGTAIADISSQSGYGQLKDSLKLTAAKCSDSYNSFTMDFSTAVTDNGKTVTSSDSVQKYDRAKNAVESVNTSENNGQKSRFYSYMDASTTISQNPSDDIYYVNQYSEPTKRAFFTRPLKSSNCEDIEKTADAVVGWPKDYVVVKDNADGSKELSGTLTEVQIPPLVNAVASLQVKQLFSNPNQTTHITKDIYVKEIKGTALINKDGVLESILGTGILSGKDAQGQVHELTFELLGKLTGINSTAVTKPDLTGKKVVQQVISKPNSGPGISDPQKFVGTFKNDIVSQKDGEFVKAGERIIDITHMDGKTVAGSYHEEYAAGFAANQKPPQDFKFTATLNKGPNQDPQGAEFTVPGTNTKGNIHFDEALGQVYFNINGPSSQAFNSVFNKVFK
ncbi:MAG: hypothetical protein M0Z55_13290 [Peptococcaceae bacterium]|nr:hypothetical protein [Peptococcaceae bacterium]